MDEERSKIKEYFDSVEMTEEFRQKLLNLPQDSASPKVNRLHRGWKPLAAAAILVLVSLAGIPLLQEKPRLPAGRPQELPAPVSSGTDPSPEGSLPDDTEPDFSEAWTDAPGSIDVPPLPAKPTRPAEPDPVRPPIPSDAEPSAPEPTVTEPYVSEPPVTEPSVTQPPVTEPPVTEPPVTQPPVTQPPVTEPDPPPPVTELDPIESETAESSPWTEEPTDWSEAPPAPGSPESLDWPAEYAVENGRSLLRVTNPETGELWELDITEEMNGNVYSGDEIIFGQEVLISLYVYETGEYDLLLLPW